MKILFSQLWIALLIVTMSADSVYAVSGKPPDVNMAEIVLHQQSTTCGEISQSQWFADKSSFESALQSMKKGTISSSPPQVPAIDFVNHAALIISMGQQRTGGYSVTLASRQMEIADNRATIRVQWTEAKPGMITIQMLTNPCLLLEVPRGNYSLIEVVDQSGKLRETISVE